MMRFARPIDQRRAVSLAADSAVRNAPIDANRSTRDAVLITKRPVPNGSALLAFGRLERRLEIERAFV